MRFFTRRYNNPNEDPLKMYYSYGTIHMAVGSPPDYSRATYGLENFKVDRFKSGNRVARFEVQTYGDFSNPDMLTFVLEGLPTSDSGLPSGTV
jgi:hypothetical protein